MRLSSQAYRFVRVECQQEEVEEVKKLFKAWKLVIEKPQTNGLWARLLFRGDL